MRQKDSDNWVSVCNGTPTDCSRARSEEQCWREQGQEHLKTKDIEVDVIRTSGGSSEEIPSFSDGVVSDISWAREQRDGRTRTRTVEIAVYGVMLVPPHDADPTVEQRPHY